MDSSYEPASSTGTGTGTGTSTSPTLSLSLSLSRDNFVPGSLDASTVHAIAAQFAVTSGHGHGGTCIKEPCQQQPEWPQVTADSLHWFAEHTRFFPFTGTGGLTLQGYFIPAAKQEQEQVNRAVSTVLFCAGWTESTIKYAKFLRRLHSHGFAIYSFDFRGQGFSQETGFDQGRVTHTTSITGEYVNDMDIFINQFVALAANNDDKLPQSQPLSNTKDTNNQQITYIGNSLAGLVGLTYAAMHPERFDHMILGCPCVQPLLARPIRWALTALRWLGFAEMLPVRLPQDISELKLTHHADNHAAWQRMREILPYLLQVEGPSVGYLTELVATANDLRTKASCIQSSVLMFQASDDVFVENGPMAEFVSLLEKSPCASLVRIQNTYHEMFVETDEVVDKVMSHILDFLKVNSSTSS